MALYFIVNPAAGRGRALRVWQALQEEMKKADINYSFAITQSPGHATTLAQHAVAAGFDTCIGVGGDGTLSEILPSLLGTNTALGCVPAGTGNDFARSLRLPRQLADILSTIVAGNRLLIDIPTVNGLHYLNVTSVGFDAAVADTVNRSFRRMHGTFPYILGVCKTLVTFQNAPLSITLDGQPPQQMQCLLAAVGNGQYYGGGFRICPKADLSDGLLDVCIAGNLTKPDVLVTLPRLIPGTHLSHPKCKYTKARRIVIGGPPLPVQADGQLIGTLPITVEITPAALWTIQPQ